VRFSIPARPAVTAIGINSRKRILDAGLITAPVSFGCSVKPASGNFSVVTFQVATLKISKRIFSESFRNPSAAVMRPASFYAIDKKISIFSISRFAFWFFGSIFK
jgi:hypothetical protein